MPSSILSVCVFFPFVSMSMFRVEEVFLVKDLQFFENYVYNWEDTTFVITELEMLTIRQVGRV